MLFNILLTIIGSYFVWTTAALFSPAALNSCQKMYDKVDYSIDSHRNLWILGTLIATGFYVYLWSTSF